MSLLSTKRSACDPVFLTQDPTSLDLLQQATKIAPTDVSVLIQGESGTGKELIAKHIHQGSDRSTGPMISINCGALPEQILVSELFGHERGAFTGAHQTKEGLLEAANGGTLFLDEIGEMGLEAQAKLLRFLQEGEVQRLGAKAPLKVDVRVISATNKELQGQVREGKFREDLYYRINTVTVRIPPLRQRPSDIPILIERFLEVGPARKLAFTPGALEILGAYRWPGNVRELQNVVERFKVLADSDTINEADIPFNIKEDTSELGSLDDSSSLLLSTVEKRHIFRVLDRFQGNKTKAAQAMGITVKTLYNKLARYEEARQAKRQPIEN